MSVAAVVTTSANTTPRSSVIMHHEVFTPSIAQTPSSAMAPPPGINIELTAAAHKVKAEADGQATRATSPQTTLKEEDSESAHGPENAVTRAPTPHPNSRGESDLSENKEGTTTPTRADMHLASAVEVAVAKANAAVSSTPPPVLLHSDPAEAATVAPRLKTPPATEPEEEKKVSAHEKPHVAVDVAEPLDQDLVLPTNLGAPTLCDRVTRVGQITLLGGTAAGLLIVGAWSAATNVSSWLTGFTFAAGGLIGSYVVIDNTCGQASRSTKLFAAAVKGYATVTAQVGRLVGRTQKSEAELKALNEKYSKLNAQLMSVTASANAETVKLQGTVEDAKKIEADLDGVVSGANAVVVADANLNKKLHDQIVEFATKVGGFKDDLNALDKDLPMMQALDQNMERSEASFAIAFANISSVFEALVGRMKDLNEMKAKVATLSTDLENLTAQFKEKETQNGELEGQIKGLLETLNKMSQSKGELERFVTKLTADIDSLKAMHATHQAEKEQWASLLDAAKSISAPAASSSSAVDLTAVQQDLSDGDQLLKQLQQA